MILPPQHDAQDAPAPARPGAGAPHEPAGTARSLDALESACAALRERVARLEADVRTLQSQNVNRA